MSGALGGWGAVAGALGLVFGASELVTRYKDQPFDAVRRAPAIVYMAVNVATSVGVFAGLVSMHDTVFPGLSLPWLAVVSGVGAMTILRSKIFNLRTKGGEDIPIGFEAVLRAFLIAADRGIDRAQAAARNAAADLAIQAHITAGTLGTEDQLKALAAALRADLGGYQNVPQDELNGFDKAIEDLMRATNTPYRYRCLSLMIAFQQIAGTENMNGASQRFKP